MARCRAGGRRWAARYRPGRLPDRRGRRRAGHRRAAGAAAVWLVQCWRRPRTCPAGPLPGLAGQPATAGPNWPWPCSIAAGGSGTSAPWWLILPEQFVLVAWYFSPIWITGLVRFFRDPGLRWCRAGRRGLPGAGRGVHADRRQALLPGCVSPRPAGRRRAARRGLGWARAPQAPGRAHHGRAGAQCAATADHLAGLAGLGGSRLTDRGAELRRGRDHRLACFRARDRNGIPVAAARRALGHGRIG